jgi:hypothetical protein
MLVVCPPILISISRTESVNRWRIQRWRRDGGGTALSHPHDVGRYGRRQWQDRTAGQPSARPPDLSRATPSSPVSIFVPNALKLTTNRHCFRNPSSQPSGMPRVFPSFRDAQDKEHALTFQGRLSSDKLLFEALDEHSRELCVKIVYRPYGEDVHRLLSDEGMAPELLGVPRIDGGPTMIVMEMLDDAWETLYDFARFNYSRWRLKRVQRAIHKRLEEIVDKIEASGFVHGDFRANNIMVKSGEEELAVLIDFDRAGKADEVHYPLNCNYSDIQWPGGPASAIQLGHDRSMLGTEWESLLDPDLG